MFGYDLDGNSELRLLEERHARELTDYDRQHLRAWLPWLDDNRTVEDRGAFIRGTLKQLANNDGFQAGIWYEGKLAGIVGYHGIDWGNRKTSLGYWLGTEFSGRGLMTESCRALTAHAFEAYGLNRVTIVCATENAKSRAIPVVPSMACIPFARCTVERTGQAPGRTFVAESGFRRGPPSTPPHLRVAGFCRRGLRDAPEDPPPSDRSEAHLLRRFGPPGGSRIPRGPNGTIVLVEPR